MVCIIYINYNNDRSLLGNFVVKMPEEHEITGSKLFTLHWGIQVAIHIAKNRVVPGRTKHIEDELRRGS
ncbi:hypothetical protein SOVF_168840 [Spinacia oleracea]|nr:hypothetical protein SOVF_168840 [Spinacia oleracea]